MKKAIWLPLLLMVSGGAAFSQEKPASERQFPAGETVVGKVTAVGKDALTVAPLAGGDPVTVKVSENTRVLKERQAVKLTDIKVDDAVFVRGRQSGATLDAAIVSVVSPEMVQRLQQSGAGGQFNREDLGKKFIAGEVKSINETKLTIARPDGQSQEIEVDENTSFKKSGESITLADIQVGDFIRGPGELKNSVFFAKELTVGRPRTMGGPARSTNPP